MGHEMESEMKPPDNPEIGRELKVSELPPAPSVVWVMKQGSPALASMRVVHIGKAHIHLVARPKGGVEFNLLLTRCGPDLEHITDDSHLPMAIFEYLGADQI
jgi:hypothetical protein